MIQTTRWSPDTCDCVIDYQWDDSIDASLRVHTPINMVKQCEDHADLITVVDIHTQVVLENQTKNIIDAQAAQIVGIPVMLVPEN